MSFFGELRRRNVVKVAVAYAIVGWLLIEVASVLLPTFQAPEWVMRVFSFFIIAGFPVALILSWAYELTPGGVERAKSVPVSESITNVTGRKLDFVIIGALVLALGFVVYNYVLEDGSEMAAGVLPNSVAVLPFENLSPNPDNAYFAAGIHDTILNELAKLQNMNVIARTSVLRYADGQTPISEIAEALNVETVMEGSVQYADGRILVTAQLINPETSAHLWSDNYDREFADIFAIQADIAMNIANAVGAEFSLEEQERIEQIPTNSPAAYALYLKARTGADSWRADLDQAIELDPEFALAYALKAYLYARILEGTGANPAESEALVAIVRQNAERALALNPNVGMAYSALASLHNAAGRLAEAQLAYEQALELSPNDPEILFLYARFKRYIGDYGDAIRLGQRSVELDPNDGNDYVQLGFSHWYALDHDAAATTFTRVSESAPGAATPHAWLGFVEVSRGNYDEALSQLRVAEQLWSDGATALRLGQVAFAYAQMDRPEDAARFFSMLESLADQRPIAEAVWAMAYLAISDYEEAYQRLENAVSNPLAADQIGLSELKANPYGDSVLDEPRWQALRDRIGALN